MFCFVFPKILIAISLELFTFLSVPSGISPCHVWLHLTSTKSACVCIHGVFKHGLSGLIWRWSSPYLKVNTIMCSLGSASWLLGRRVCSVIREAGQRSGGVRMEEA